MSTESTPAIVAAAISGLLCLLIGGAVAYFVLAPGPGAPPPISRAPDTVVPDEKKAETSPQPEKAGQQDRAATPAASAEIEKLRKGNSVLVTERDKLREENSGLREQLSQADNELKAFRALQASRRGKLAINFAQYADVKELQDADWKELGAALQTISPTLSQLAQSMRDGKAPDREIVEKIGKDNVKLIKLALALEGKLPTHAGNVNGEYTHPAAQINLLAAQLEAMGDPLADEQKLKLAEIGEEYEKRWEVLQKGYSDDTLALQKVLDEADLKMWFTERMFSITTQQQKVKVVDPSVEGIMMLDLYSPGLLLLPLMNSIYVKGAASPKEQYKAWLASDLDVKPELLNGMEYAFDEWQSKLQLAPVPEAQTRLTHVSKVLQAGRAQLSLMQTLAATALSAPEQLKKVREHRNIGVPYVIQQD